MKLVLVRHLWGVDLSRGYSAHFNAWREAGYSVLEGSARLVPDAEALRRALRNEGFGWIPQVFTHLQQGGGTVRQHLESLRLQIEECLDAEPLFFNGQTGSDHWTLDEAEDFYGAVGAMEREFGVFICHETHRSRYLGNPWNAARLLECVPTLKLTCDFSHWVCVAERLLGDADAVIARAASRCHHLHARVGHEQGPQVPDPRDPMWAVHLRAHEGWWLLCWAAAQMRSEAVVTLTPEFGPPPYQPVMPFTHAPVGDLTKICDWMARRQVEHFAAWSKTSAIPESVQA